VGCFSLDSRALEPEASVSAAGYAGYFSNNTLEEYHAIDAILTLGHEDENSEEDSGNGDLGLIEGELWARFDSNDVISAEFTANHCNENLFIGVEE
jgi:hypothetical protein